MDIDGWQHVIPGKTLKHIKASPETFRYEERDWELKLSWEDFNPDNDCDVDSDDSFEDAHEAGAKSMMNSDASDPSKLIDLELVNLLRYCYNL